MALATHRFTRLGDVRNASQCELLQAQTELEDGRFDEAEQHLSALKSRAEVFGDAGLAARCDLYLGLLYWETNRPGHAIAVLESALTRLPTIDIDEYFLGAGVLAQLYLQTGRPGDAERVATAAHQQAGNTGDDAPIAACAEGLALCLAEQGRTGEAQRLLVQAARLYLGIGKRDQAARAAHLLSSLDVSTAGFSNAESRLRALRRIFVDLDMHADAAEADLQLGLLLHYVRAEDAFRRGDLLTAQSLTRSALTSTVPSQQARADAVDEVPVRIMRAVHLQLAGVMAGRRHSWTESVRLLAQGSTEFSGVGLYHRAAMSDALAGAFMVDGAQHSSLCRPPTDALDLLVPAYLHLDRIRLQFPGSTDRRAWRESCSWIVNLAMRIGWLAGDGRLVAELVEAVINRGVHSSKSFGPDEPAGLIEALAGAAAPTSAAEPAGSPARRHGRCGALSIFASGPAGRRLLGDLPMQPPPTLVLADGSPLLDRYHRMRATRYPAETDTPDTVCPVIW